MQEKKRYDAIFLGEILTHIHTHTRTHTGEEKLRCNFPRRNAYFGCAPGMGGSRGHTKEREKPE